MLVTVRSQPSAGCFGDFVLSVRLLSAVFLQLVVQGLQADSQDVGGPCLVVVGGFEGFQDEQTLGFIDGGSHAEPNCVCFLHRGAREDVAKARRQVPDVDDRAFADDNGAF